MEASFISHLAWREKKKKSIYTFPENTQLGSSLAVRDYNVVMLISKIKALVSILFCIMITSYRRQIIKWFKKVKETITIEAISLRILWKLINHLSIQIIKISRMVLIKGNGYFLLCAQINMIEFFLENR